jgi:hypothetical protein
VRRRSPGPSEYHPRVYRPVANTEEEREGPPLDATALVSSTSAAQLLFARARAVFGTIEPVPAHAEVYGHELRQLLILACTEVEAAWRGILSANWPNPRPLRDAWKTKQYVRVGAPLRLAEWAVRLGRDPGRSEYAPFAAWSTAAPTASLAWYEAYHAAKHDREANLCRATLGHTVHALAAVYVLLLAQFGPTQAAASLARENDLFVIARQPSWDATTSYCRGPHRLPPEADTSYWNRGWRAVPLF